MDIFSRKCAPLSELKRICDLDQVSELSEGEVQEASKHFVKESALKNGFFLLPAQAAMTLQYVNYNGLFGGAAAGDGKTLTSLLIENLAFRGEHTGKCRKILHLLPSNLVDQLKRDIKWSRQKIHINTPYHFISDYKNPEDRMNLASNGGEGVYVLGYGLLSGKDTEEIIHKIKPQLIVADECHTLTNRKSARTRRVMNYLTKNPYTKLVLLSGTICRKTIKEYHHLITYALKDNSPVPMHWHQAETLSIALEGVGDFFPAAEVRLAKPLADWAGEKWYAGITENIDGLRRAYNKRLRTCPGVYISGNSEVASSLVLNCIRTKGHGSSEENYQELKRLIKDVNETWTTPSGDEFDYALQKFKWMNELSQGFYNNLIWPEEGTPLLAEAKARFDVEQELNRQVRQFLGGRHREGLDTPLLLRLSMKNHGAEHVGSDLYAVWKQWKSMDQKGLPSRISVPVRVSDFKINETVSAWNKLNKDKSGGVIWFYHQAFGKWLFDSFEGREDVMLAPAGSKMKEFITNPDNVKGKTVIATMSGHGTGTNGLQHIFDKSLYAQNLHTATLAEQSLARLHRHGQESDQVEAHIMTASVYDDMHLTGILRNSYFLHLTHGKQRLLLGSWINAPKHFDTTELLEAGVDLPKGLDKQQLMELEELI